MAVTSVTSAPVGGDLNSFLGTIPQESCKELYKNQVDFNNWQRALLGDAKVAQKEVAAAQQVIDKANTALAHDQSLLATDQQKVTQAQHEFDVAEEFLHSPAASDSNNFQNFLREAQAAAQRLAIAKQNVSGDQHNIMADQQNKQAGEQDKIDANFKLTNTIPADLAICGKILVSVAETIQKKCKNYLASDFLPDSEFTGADVTPTTTVSNNNSPGSNGGGATGNLGASGAQGPTTPPDVNSGNQTTVFNSINVPFLDGGVVSADPGLPSNNATGFGGGTIVTVPQIPTIADPGSVFLFNPPNVGGGITNPFTTGGITNAIFGLPVTANGQILPTDFTSFQGNFAQPIANQAVFGSPFTSFTDIPNSLANLGSITVVAGGSGNDGSFSINTGSLGDTGI